MASVVRGRFAPTPSGLMHVGNAWTALLSWCEARTAGGSWVIRIEDLDAPRCRPEWMAQCLEDLLWLGLDWDEGPDVGGPYGPYLQQARIHLYVDALTRLEAKGQLYPCFCSRAELSRLASAPHGLGGERV
jgi:glutamyl-tRNA synthetase